MSDVEERTLNALYEAVTKYIKARGGYVAIIGGTEIQQWTGDLEYNFRLAVKFTGRKPSLPAPPKED